MTTNDPKVLVTNPRFRVVDENGDPIPGAKVFTYYPGTTTKRPTWTDPTGLTLNANPIICDANGECDIYVEPQAPFNVDAVPAGPPGPPGPPGPAGPPGATGNTAEFSVVTDIPSETIYSGMFGEDGYVDITSNGSAAVAGTGFIPVMVALNFHYRTSPFAMNSANFQLNWGPPTFPSAVPNGSISAAFLEGTTDVVVFIPVDTGLNGEQVSAIDIDGKPLTLTFDAEPDGPPLISIGVSDPGTGYADDDEGTIDGGNGDATYKIISQTGGVPTEVELTFGGTGYSTDTGVTTAATSGAGTGLTLDTVSAETIGGSVRATVYYRKLTLVPA